MTIRTRLISIQLITTFTVLLLGSAAFVYNEIRAYRTGLVNDLSSMALFAGENSASSLVFLDNRSATQILSSLRVEPFIDHACIYDSEGSVFAEYHRQGEATLAFPSAGEPSETFGEGYLDLFRRIEKNDEKIGTIFLRANLAELDEKISDFVGDAIAVLVVGMGLSVILALFLQRSISEPVLALVTTTRAVSETGDYSQRVAHEGDDELGALSEAYNDMLEQIQGRDQSLQEARSSLEQRVDERTSELSQAKVELEKALGDAVEARVSAEDAMRAAEEANRTKSLFLANMSHEIRTPLNAVLGYVQILQGDDSLSSDQRTAIDTIGSSGSHLLSLINDILDISKIEAGKSEFTPAEFDLTGMITSLASMFEMRCNQKGLDFQLTMEGLPDRLVIGDENKLRQVLINLMGNAVKFTQEGSVSLEVSALDDANYHFSVTDTGPGIAPELQEKIFEPFHQEAEGHEQGGTGLGLAICLGHMDLMGGQLNLESTQGEGATFSFDLSLETGGVVQPKEADSVLDWSLANRLESGQNVYALIVDDVATNRDILERVLKRVGVEVNTASNGQDALDSVRDRMPDIVFLDIRMPGMNGLEVIGKLIEEHGRSATVVVAVTASVFEHQQRSYLEAGFDGFIDKPIRTDHVMACLHEKLGLAFEFGTADHTPADTGFSDDWQEVDLPGKLLEELKEAVTTHSVTDLRRGIEKLEGMGDRERTFAAHLRELGNAFDMDGIRQVLDSLNR